jgi:hypothetical protein
MLHISLFFVGIRLFLDLELFICIFYKLNETFFILKNNSSTTNIRYKRTQILHYKLFDKINKFINGYFSVAPSTLKNYITISIILRNRNGDRQPP